MAHHLKISNRAGLRGFCFSCSIHFLPFYCNLTAMCFIVLILQSSGNTFSGYSVDNITNKQAGSPALMQKEPSETAEKVLLCVSF